MDKEAFEAFFLEALPAAAHTSNMYWRRFDSNESGMINIVEFISGLCVMCSAGVGEKVEFIFEINDFNGQGNLSYDELVVLLYLACSATVLISGKGVFPEEHNVERIADEAFIFADIDMTGRINLKSFKLWINEFLGISEETPTVGLREYLKKMKSLKHSKVAGRTAGQQGLAEHTANANAAASSSNSQTSSVVKSSNKSLDSSN
jgi:Ca2+-binding EF-hand superfamily protein